MKGSVRNTFFLFSVKKKDTNGNVWTCCLSAPHGLSLIPTWWEYLIFYTVIHSQKVMENQHDWWKTFHLNGDCVDSSIITVLYNNNISQNNKYDKKSTLPSKCIIIKIDLIIEFIKTSSANLPIMVTGWCNVWNFRPGSRTICIWYRCVVLLLIHY